MVLSNWGYDSRLTLLYFWLFQQRTKEAVKTPAVDIVVPMHLRKLAKPSQSSDALPETPFVNELSGLQFNKSEKQASQPKSSNKSFNFVVMMKKGNKTQFHGMEVPLASEFANQFIAREEVCVTYFTSY